MRIEALCKNFWNAFLPLKVNLFCFKIKKRNKYMVKLFDLLRDVPILPVSDKNCRFLVKLSNPNNKKGHLVSTKQPF